MREEPKRCIVHFLALLYLRRMRDDLSAACTSRLCYIRRMRDRPKRCIVHFLLCYTYAECETNALLYLRMREEPKRCIVHFLGIAILYDECETNVSAPLLLHCAANDAMRARLLLSDECETT
ncbi:hypothetical protein EVAR_76078_1 [Eumeta japonica]|uniref:Uncharacterized protein n=1 Tax=Eumeta variegata TaxID=151549 RepID=A0A4C1W448_EUMVA|nr:hypothetical protein EVAR_76078_1 [Eumeta japonica]